ncbi:MAG TPA: cytochrome c biogenesis protein CcsA, partial [Bacilli bacterium]
HSVFYFVRLFANDFQFSVSMFDTLFLLSWLTVTISLLISYLMRIEFLVLFLSLVGFSVVIFNLWNDRAAVSFVNEALISNVLLFVHILLGMGSYVAFLIAALFSFMYLFLHRKLKEKQWSGTMQRLPSLEKIERYSYLSVAIGVIFLLTSVTIGSISMISLDRANQLIDYKVLNSVLILIGYGFYLLQRFFLRWPGHKLSIWGLICFAFVFINYTAANWISDFHHWIWM